MRVGRPRTEDRIRDFEERTAPNRKFPTKAGILVASHGEQLIADTLWSNSIPFDYDTLLILSEDGEELTPSQSNERKRDGEQVYWVRPDFRLKGVKIVIEYWGMIGGRSEEESVSEAYEHKREKKREEYRLTGFALIEIDRAHFHHLDSELLEKIREAKREARGLENEQDVGFKIQDLKNKEGIPDENLGDCARGIHRFPEQEYGTDGENYCIFCGESNRNRRRF